MNAFFLPFCFAMLRYTAKNASKCNKEDKEHGMAKKERKRPYSVLLIIFTLLCIIINKESHDESNIFLFFEQGLKR